MRTSKESKDVTRPEYIHYMKIAEGVIYPDKHYTVADFASYMVFLEDMYNVLASKIPESTRKMVVRVVKAENQTLGLPLDGAPWDDEVNVRGPFWTVIPGTISEMISAYNLYEDYNFILHPQDRLTQYVKCIDMMVGKTWKSIQVKTITCKGRNIYIDPDWIKGEADMVSLVDIDDQEHYYIERLKLKELVGTDVYDGHLKNLCTKFWDNDGKYPRRHVS